MYYKSYSDLSSDIKKKLPLLIQEDFDLIVGIPRSGMIPAYMIAFNLNINCTSVESFIANEKLSHGITRTPKKFLKTAWDATKILLVDDSIKSGDSLTKVMERIPEEVKSRITTLAVYSGKSGSEKVDLFFEYLPWPRLFEWNILHHTALPFYCFEIDGILCQEISENNINDEAYKKNILNAKQLIVPNTRINSLVTNRSEKYRAETEIWLKKHDVLYDRLVMLSDKKSSLKDINKSKIQHKAQYYKNSNTILFIEKDPYLALNIAKMSLKPVFCYTDNVMYKPDALDLLKNDPKYILNQGKRIIKKIITYFRRGSDSQSTNNEESMLIRKKVAKSA